MHEGNNFIGNRKQKIKTSQRLAKGKNQMMFCVTTKSDKNERRKTIAAAWNSCWPILFIGKNKKQTNECVIL